MFKKNLPFFTTIILLIFLFFNRAFSMNFFKDDYFFLKISHINNIQGFINFFSPIRTYSYKPLASEVFYFFIRNNIFLGHLIVFITYIIGLYFLFQIVQIIFKKTVFSYIFVFLYAVSFIHVFQLYWLSTYQEIVVFTCLTLSFYLFLKNIFFFCFVFYVFALLSKETAILFMPFFLLVIFLLKRNKIKLFIKPIIIYILISLGFLLIYRYSLKFVTSLDNYKIEWNMKLIFNNSFWYFMWGLGFPSFLPDYTKSIFFKFLPEFWSQFKNIEFKIYFFGLLSYLSLFFTTLIFYIFKFKEEAKKIFLISLFSIVCFFIFLGPILFFPHRWMIRLTLPLIFILFLQAYLISLFFSKKSFKLLAIVLIGIYCLWNFFGVKIHQVSSAYSLESKISANTKNYFLKNSREIEKHKYIYFKDPSQTLNAWGESMKLENSFHGQFFLDYYFPNKNLTAIWGYKQKNIPKDSYIINSVDLLLY